MKHARGSRTMRENHSTPRFFDVKNLPFHEQFGHGTVAAKKSSNEVDTENRFNKVRTPFGKLTN